MPEVLNVGAALCRRLKDFTARLEAGDDSLFRKQGDVSLRQDIARYLASLPPHVADRKAALLLREALTALDVADGIIAAMPEWTPVSERLPPEAEPVIGYRKGFPGVFECFREDGEWLTGPDVVLGGATRPTHWQPLPEPPADCK